MEVSELPVAVVTLDRDRVITSANAAALGLLRTTQDRLVGASCAETIRPRKPSGEDLLARDWHPSAYLTSTRRLNEQEVSVRCGDGSEIDLVVDGGYDRADDGQLRGAVLLLRPRNRGPRRPRSGMRIVSAVSHELRSPLTSVRGYTTMLLKRWEVISDSERKQMLAQVDRDARRISRMIGELLDITRLELGRIQLNRTEMTIGDVIDEVAAKVKMSYPDASVEVLGARHAPRVWADVDKIDQVLTNLIENACKYASPVGIQVVVSADADSLVVEVQDRGPGIPESDLPRLFQQFFRSSHGRPTGTGLGLWISRGLIESHGGSLTAMSAEATGSQFRFTLPLNAFDDLHGRMDR